MRAGHCSAIPWGPAVTFSEKAFQPATKAALVAEEETALAADEEDEEATLAAEDALEDAPTGVLTLSAQKPGALMLPLAGMVLFHAMEDTVTVLPLCDQAAFHTCLILALGSVKLPRQPSIGAALVLRTVMAPQKPEPHSLVV